MEKLFKFHMISIFFKFRILNLRDIIDFFIRKTGIKYLATRYDWLLWAQESTCTSANPFSTAIVFMILLLLPLNSDIRLLLCIYLYFKVLLKNYLLKWIKRKKQWKKLATNNRNCIVSTESLIDPHTTKKDIKAYYVCTNYEIICISSGMLIISTWFRTTVIIDCYFIFLQVWELFP